METSLLDYHLPTELIAQRPALRRDGARLMACRRAGGAPQNLAFSSFPDLLREGDVLVVNDTAVYPARLVGVTAGQPVELFLLKKLAPGRYRVLTRPSKKVGLGTRVAFPPSGLHAEVTAVLTGSERVAEFYGVSDVETAIDDVGRVPLPPYIKRPSGPTEEDRERYQTIFARRRGSVAAPTAGLHFTAETLENIKQRGCEVVEVTLHVSYGTFKPVRTKTLEEHELDKEEVTVSRSAARAISAAKLDGRRIVAVGTTTVRALETAADKAGMVGPFKGETSLAIYPGYKFKVVDALLTNFHLPRSSLLALVAAFAGIHNVKTWYAEAVKERYRFYSYGDAMFVY